MNKDKGNGSCYKDKININVIKHIGCSGGGLSYGVLTLDIISTVNMKYSVGVKR